MESSWGEEFSEEGEDLSACRFVDLSHALHEPAVIHGPDLIQHDLTRFAFESHRDAGGVGKALGQGCVSAHPGWAGESRCHGGDDHGIDVLVHFVRGDDEARAGFADLTALGKIEAEEVDVEAGHYHVHSLRSHVDGVADS